MSYRDDKQGQTDLHMLLEKAALGVLSVHFGRDYKHAEDAYSPVDGCLLGGIWTFVEHKSRGDRRPAYKYIHKLTIPARKVENLIELCSEHEALPAYSVWVLDAPGPIGQLYYREIQHDEVEKFGTGRMKKHVNPRPGISEDSSTEQAVVYDLTRDFARIF